MVHPHNLTQAVAAGAAGNNSSSALDVNGTEGDTGGDADILPAFRNVIILLYVLVIVVAVIGNGCVIYLVVSQRQMRNVTNYFIASLATSDALMALVCIPTTFIPNVLVESWPFPAWMCPFATYFQIVIVFQNAYTLVAISLERYIAIMYPFKRRLTMCQCYMVIGLTWFMSFGTPLPTAVVSKMVVTYSEEDPNVTYDRCYERWPTEEQLFSYSMTIMVLQYFVPLAVLIYTYIRIVIVVWLKDTPPHGQMGASSARPVLQHRESTGGFDTNPRTYVDPRKRIIKMMMTVVGIYATCWLPIHLITIIGDIDSDIWMIPAMRYVWLSAHWLAMSSCMYNPLIYWWMSEKFRWGYKFLVRKIKYQCCQCGHDHMVLMNMRNAQFLSSYSQADYVPRNNPHKQNHVRATERENYRRFAGGGGGGGGAGGCVGGVGGAGGYGVGGVVGGDSNGSGGSFNGYRGGKSLSGGDDAGDRDFTEGPFPGGRREEGEKGKGHKQNGVSFRCDLIVDKGETIPLRKPSDPTESGLGSDDGDDLDDHHGPAHV